MTLPESLTDLTQQAQNQDIIQLTCKETQRLIDWSIDPPNFPDSIIYKYPLGFHPLDGLSLSPSLFWLLSFPCLVLLLFPCFASLIYMNCPPLPAHVYLAGLPFFSWLGPLTSPGWAPVIFLVVSFAWLCSLYFPSRSPSPPLVVLPFLPWLASYPSLVGLPFLACLCSLTILGYLYSHSWLGYFFFAGWTSFHPWFSSLPFVNEAPVCTFN